VKVRSEGTPFILAGLILILVAGLLGLFVIAFLFCLGTMLMLKFFSDPERLVPPSGDVMVSPADGKVIQAELKEKEAIITIFMSLFNCHINRAPLDGKVRKVCHLEGSHSSAMSEKAEFNEKKEIIFDTLYGELKLYQIVGLLARRIMCWVSPTDEVKKGQKIGMIIFGSRVKVSFSSDGWQLLVKCGDKVKAGESIIAVRIS